MRERNPAEQQRPSSSAAAAPARRPPAPPAALSLVFGTRVGVTAHAHAEVEAEHAPPLTHAFVVVTFGLGNVSVTAHREI